MTDNDTYERDLTPAEIAERTQLRDELDDERDKLLTAVDDRRREIRGFNSTRKRLEVSIRDLRREIRSGKVIESRQMTFAIDVIAPNAFDVFHRRFPMAGDAEALHRQLSVVLQGVLVPSIEQLGEWHPSTGIFHAVAHWTRVESAYMNAKAHPDLELPPRMPMPVPLAEVRGQLGRTGKKRKPRLAKVRAAEGTPIRKGQRGRSKRKARA